MCQALYREGVVGKAFAKGVATCMFASICDTITGAVVHALSMTCSMHACLSQCAATHTGSHMDTRKQSCSLEC